jgi:hypothetical protein
MSQEDYPYADPALPSFFYQSLQPNTPLVNLFLTGFDQQNPLSFGSQGGDTFMGNYQDYEGQEGQGKEL